MLPYFCAVLRISPVVFLYHLSCCLHLFLYYNIQFCRFPSSCQRLLLLMSRIFNFHATSSIHHVIQPAREGYRGKIEEICSTLFVMISMQPCLGPGFRLLLLRSSLLSCQAPKVLLNRWSQLVVHFPNLHHLALL